MVDKKIPLKNYIIIVAIFICSVALAIYLINAYYNHKIYQNNENKTMAFLTEVETDSLDSYLIDNHEAIIYISASTDSDIKNYELALKKFIIEENLERSILYLDASELNDEFYETMANKYSYNLDLNLKKANPNFWVIVDNKITDVLYSDVHELDINKAKEFLKAKIGV